MDGVDLAFMSMLERWLLRELHGDPNMQQGQPGLYRGLMASQDWETFQRTKGIIQGYDNVLTTMKQIAHHMNEPPAQGASAGRTH